MMTLTMSAETLLAFVAAMVLLSLTPGPGVLAVVARALTHGFAAGLAAISGLVVGDILFLVLAIAGLSALAAVLGEFFLVVKVLGAAYLIWLGVKLWRSKAQLPAEAAQAEPGNGQRRHGRSFAVGFLVTIANPKAILFYGAFVPTFIDVTVLGLADVAVLAAVVMFVLFLVLGTCAFVAARAGRAIRSVPATAWLNRVSGGLLVGAGVVVATR